MADKARDPFGIPCNPHEREGNYIEGKISTRTIQPYQKKVPLNEGDFHINMM